MKRILFISSLLLCFVPCILLAQSTLLFEDNFENNSKKWPVKCTEKILTDIKNSKYYLERFTDTGGDVFMNKVYYNTKKDFIIEAKFRQTSCKGNHGFGLVWDARDNQYTKNFIISPNKFFTVYHTKNGKYHAIKKWTKLRSINRKGKDNILRIHKKGTVIKFYINGQLVYSKNDSYAFGSKIGFKVTYKMKVEVDYIKFYQDDWKYDPKINLMELSDEDKMNQKENLGPNINSSYCEKSPVISPDGQILFVNRHNHPRDGQGKKRDKIWYSLRNGQDNWSACQNIGPPLNNENHNFVVSVSGDNNTVYLGNQYKADGSAGGVGMSVSNRTVKGWGIPQKVDISNYVNYSDRVNYFMSPSRKILIVATENEDTYGFHDLFVYFEKNGAYVNPINLGPTINTAESDFSPFLASDNKTLYFASSGHAGYGQADIFVTKRLDDSWTNWSIPQNLGNIINSDRWDAYYKIPASGEYAYVVSDHKSIGKEDIFRVKLPEEARPEPVLMVYGKVLNAKTNEPVQTDITYYDLVTGGEEGKAISNPLDGTYKIILPYGKKYSFLAFEDSYYSISDFLDVSNIKHYAEIERNLYLNPVEKDEVIPVNNLFFEDNQASLQKESHAELDRLAKLLHQNPNMKIDIKGHSNNKGTAEENQKLSEERAASVLHYLVEKKGVEKQRVTSQGFGKRRIIGNPENQQKRIMEFKIISK